MTADGFRAQRGGRRRLLGAMLCLTGLATASCTLLPPAPAADVFIGPTSIPADEPQPASRPASAAHEPSAAEPVAVTVDEAIVMALDRNRNLSVQRLDPSIVQTFEQEERAAFDPLLSAEAADAHERAPRTGGGHVRTGETVVEAAVSQFLPTGTDVSAGVSTALLTGNLRSDQYVTRAGLSVTQALLRGAGLDFNLANVRQARLDTLASEYELRGFAEALVAQTERTYWDYALAQRTMEIVTNALTLAEQQRDEVQERIRVGSLAEIELAAAEAEVARRRENLINARSLLATTRLVLLRLLNPSDDDFWDRDVVLRTLPVVPQVELDDVDVHVAIALRMRPDLNQARLGVQRNDLELVKTRNGLLPRLDLFVSLGKSGYADSFGESFARLDGEDYDVLAGVRFDYPPANRFAEARHERAAYSHERALRAVDNLAQLVQVDVRAAYIEVGRAGEQVTATAATRRFQEETLRAETEKFRVGKSTSFLVAQAQRDLLVSQISEVAAVVNHLQALIGLHLQEGSLLERRGITAPGAQPVELARPQW